MSAATLEYLARGQPGFRFKVVDPTAAGQIIRPKKAAGRAWTNCDLWRMTSWELALGRVTTDVPCEGTPGHCRRLGDDRLVYVVVTTYFGDGALSKGVPMPVRHNVEIIRWSFVNAKTGELVLAGQDG